VKVGSCSGLAISSPIPSAILEHEEHMFGFLEKAFPVSDIGSPQQIQIRGLIFPLPLYCK
jgi:hypothetical protein